MVQTARLGGGEMGDDSGLPGAGLALLLAPAVQMVGSQGLADCRRARKMAKVAECSSRCGEGHCALGGLEF
jgi:hypothetical protein